MTRNDFDRVEHNVLYGANEDVREEWETIKSQLEENKQLKTKVKNMTNRIKLIEEALELVTIELKKTIKLKSEIRSYVKKLWNSADNNDTVLFEECLNELEELGS